MNHTIQAISHTAHDHTHYISKRKFLPSSQSNIIQQRRPLCLNLAQGDLRLLGGGSPLPIFRNVHHIIPLFEQCSNTCKVYMQRFDRIYARLYTREGNRLAYFRIFLEADTDGLVYVKGSVRFQEAGPPKSLVSN